MPSLIDILNDQFEATQDYCNAQTALRNALQSDALSGSNRTTSVVSATIQYESALRAIQTATRAVDEEYRRLQSENKILRPSRLELLEQHMERTKRVIQSVSAAPVVHSNGILNAQSVSIHDMTVALSVLRASIRTMSESPT